MAYVDLQVQNGAKMSEKLEILKEKPYPLGCYIDYDKSLVVRTVFDGDKTCGIALYKGTSNDGETALKIKFPKYLKRGSIYAARIKGIENIDEYSSYNYFVDSTYFCDSYAKHLLGLETFGLDVPDCDIRAKLDNRSTLKASEYSFDWGNDSFPDIPYEDSFVYLLHVRGFTKSSGSGVPSHHRGTFMGILDKIPYLKSIGVTTVELMPAIEMNEVETLETHGGILSKELLYSKDGSISNTNSIKPRLNFWGYKKGFYFAPRTAYCSNPDDAENEFKYFIKTMHENGLEVIMQFFFEENENESLIIDALRYWRCSYHVDGFHLKGARIPISLITREPLFADAKIWYDWFEDSSDPSKRYLAVYNNSFLYASRRFLKSDDNSASDFFHAMIANGNTHGVINYICDYEGFRLADLVAYEHKHNEENGENNKDGTDNNLSWNCGIEGRTRKQSILELRKKQVKNILTMLLLAQGTPMIFSGDEFCSSQAGNNNPYCQDNETGWVDWKALEKNAEIFEYFKFLLKLRFDHKVLHNTSTFKLMDYISCGYPDLSCHGRDAWRPDFTGHSHILGMLYCGQYDKSDKNSPFIYVCYNMHWMAEEIALPKLPDGLRWKMISDTESVSKIDNTDKKNNSVEKMSERSVRIYISETDPENKSKRKLKRK